MKRKVVVGIVFACILVALIALFYSTKKTNTSDHPSTSRIQSALKDSSVAPLYNDFIPKGTTTDTNPGYRTSPEFKIGKYIVSSILPEAPGDLPLYQFKTSFSDTEKMDLAVRLLGQTAQKSADTNNISYFSGELGTLSFDNKTGGFSMSSLFLQLPSAISNYKNIDEARPILADYFVNKLKVIDSSVTLTALYQKKEEENITYYEFHREHQQMGLPIINPAGAINADEAVPLIDIATGASIQKGAEDQSIIFASDQPGRPRQTDFNTMTVGITSSGYIISIESNIRPIIKKELTSTKNLSVLSPKKALEELAENGSYFDIVIPAGQGNLDLNKVYDNKQLLSDEATVTDISLVLIEKPGSIAQEYLQPAYIFRGHTVSDTGVRLKFSRTVPAIEGADVLSEGVKPSLFSLLIDKLFRPVFAQSEGSSEIVIPCEDGNSARCRIVRVRKTPVPPTPTATLQSPTIIAPTPGLNICVLYTREGRVVENGVPLFIPGLGTIYYFPTALPNGPIAIPWGLGNNTGVTNTAKFKKAVNDHLVAVAAQRILANPSLPYFTAGNNAYYSIHLNAVFPESGIDFDKPPAAGSYSVSADDTYIKQRLYRVHYPTSTDHPSLEELAQQGVIPAIAQNNISIAQLWNFRQKAPLGIYGNYVASLNCQITSTVSPNMYFYPQQSMRLQLSFASDAISYVDPIKAEVLKFEAETNGTLSFSEVKRDYIHYEYTDKVSFERPKLGWIIPSESLEAFIQTKLGEESGLNSQEREGLIKEVRGALYKKPIGKNMFIGIIPESELNKKLPFTVMPKSDSISRLHLYVEYVSDLESVQAPKIMPVERSGFYIVETGAYAK